MLHSSSVVVSGCVVLTVMWWFQVLFALVVAVASAAFIPVLDVDRSFPARDEFDQPIVTAGQKIAFDVRTKSLRTAHDMPIVPYAAFGYPAASVHYL